MNGNHEGPEPERLAGKRYPYAGPHRSDLPAVHAASITDCSRGSAELHASIEGPEGPCCDAPGGKKPSRVCSVFARLSRYHLTGPGIRRQRTPAAGRPGRRRPGRGPRPATSTRDGSCAPTLARKPQRSTITTTSARAYSPRLWPAAPSATPASAFPTPAGSPPPRTPAPRQRQTRWVPRPMPPRRQKATTLDMTDRL